MVTNIKEGKTKKCEQYWPAESGRGQNYGPFNVSIVEQHIFADYTIRTIQLVVSKINCSRIFVCKEESLALSMYVNNNIIRQFNAIIKLVFYTYMLNFESQ